MTFDAVLHTTGLLSAGKTQLTTFSHKEDSRRRHVPMSFHSRCNADFLEICRGNIELLIVRHALALL